MLIRSTLAAILSFLTGYDRNSRATNNRILTEVQCPDGENEMLAKLAARNLVSS